MDKRLGATMPTLADLQAATPRCHQHRIDRTGQHGVHYTCWTPMTYQPELNYWTCPTCANAIEGTLIAHRQRALLGDVAA